MPRVKLGDLLLKAGLIDEVQLQSALGYQRQWGGKLGDVLITNGFLDEMMLWRGLSKQLSVPLVSLPEHTFPAGIEKLVPVEMCRKHSIVPMTRDNREVTIATSEPNNIAGIDEVAFRVGARLRVVLAPDREIEWAVRKLYTGETAPCPPPRQRRVASNDPGPDPGTQTTQMRGQVVDFAARSPATPIAEIHGAARAAAAAAPLFGTPMPGALIPGTPGGPMAGPPAAGVPTGVPYALPPQPAAPTFGAAPPVNPFAVPASSPPSFAVPASSPTSFAVPASSPTSFPGGTGGTPPTAAQTEAALRETSALLRWVVEACIARGVFSREEYIARVRAQT